MTSDEEKNRPEQGAAPRDAEQARSLWMWPTFTLTLTMFPALASVILVDLTSQTFCEAAASVAGWLLNTNAEQGVEMTSGFAFLAVMATIVIGIAFSLPPKGIQVLPEKNRTLIEVLTLGVTLLVSLFSAAVLWVIVWQRVTFELVLLLLSAWLVSVVAGLIPLKRPAAERLYTARREREKLRVAAEKWGITTSTTIAWRQRVGAEGVYWLIPVVGVPLLGGAGLVRDFRGFQIHLVAWEFLVALGLGAVIVSVMWRAITPFPPHRLSNRALSWIGRSFGLFLMVLAVLGALLARLWGFAALSAFAIGVVVALYIVPVTPSHLPFIRTLRTAATLKQLMQAEKSWDSVRQELDDEREHESATSRREGAERQPVIRIEVFRPRLRRRSSEGDT